MMLNKWWKKSPSVLQATCKINLHISNVIWNLLLLHASQLFKTYNSNLTFPKAKYGEKSQDFNTKDFCKTINYIQDHFQTRNFNYTAVESPGRGSHRTKFQDKCLLIYFSSAEIFFALSLRHTFYVFISQVQNERGILSLVDQKLA